MTTRDRLAKRLGHIYAGRPEPNGVDFLAADAVLDELGWNDAPTAVFETSPFAEDFEATGMFRLIRDEGVQE